MQTFLPFAHNRESLRTLDNDRAWKQCVEVKQLVIAMDEGSQHQYHPACKMWMGYREALIQYGQDACDVWTGRGGNDGDIWAWLEYRKSGGEIILPPWYGSYLFHRSHRANLQRKGHTGFSERPQPYFWPTATYDWRTNPGDLFDPTSRKLYATLTENIPVYLRVS